LAALRKARVGRSIRINKLGDDPADCRDRIPTVAIAETGRLRLTALPLSREDPARRKWTRIQGCPDVARYGATGLFLISERLRYPVPITVATAPADHDPILAGIGLSAGVELRENRGLEVFLTDWSRPGLRSLRGDQKQSEMHAENPCRLNLPVAT
jgi:hypothetical protein